jgi:hypothetical protein
MSGASPAVRARAGSVPCIGSVSMMALILLLTCATGCSSCPPGWVDSLPSESGWRFASGHCGEVFVDADPTSLALSRAARRLADDLGLVLEERLSVRHLDGRLFVEAVGVQGLTDALDDLELVELVTCDGTVYALIRLPVDP